MHRYTLWLVCVLAAPAAAQDTNVLFSSLTGESYTLKGQVDVNALGEVEAFGARAFEQPEAWMPNWDLANWDGTTLTVSGYGCVGTTDDIIQCRAGQSFYHAMDLVSVANGPTDWYVDGQLWRQWDTTDYTVRVVPEPSSLLLLVIGCCIAMSRRYR